MNTPSDLDTLPWFKQFWPWFLIALPATVVVAAFVTLYIANRHSDDLVSKDYYKNGLAINLQLESKNLAEELLITSELIGLTIVSIGTSLPELATSVMASLRGQRDMAVGNIVGSNLFNIMAVLGLTAVVAPDGVPVAEQALGFDIPVMVAVMAICLPIFFTRYLIRRWEGLLLTSCYLVYTLYLVLSAIDHQTLPALSVGLLWVALPLTVLLLTITTGRSLYDRRVDACET